MKSPLTEFEFYPPDHSVVQSHYEHGCIPYEYVDEGEDGFYSGPQILSGISDDVSGTAVLPTSCNTYSLTSPETEIPRRNQQHRPNLLLLWRCGILQGQAHDRRHQSCESPVRTDTSPPSLPLSASLTSLVAQNKDQTLEGYLASVEQADFELVPGQDWPTEGEDGDDESDSDSGSQPPAAPANSDNSHHSLSPGAIAGIAIGGVAVLLIAAALIYLCGRRGGKDNAYRKSLMGQWGHKGPPPSPFPPVAAIEPKTMTPMTMGTGQEWNSPMASPGYMATTHQHAMEVPDGSHYTGASISG